MRPDERRLDQGRVRPQVQLPRRPHPLTAATKEARPRPTARRASACATALRAGCTIRRMIYTGGLEASCPTIRRSSSPFPSCANGRRALRPISMCVESGKPGPTVMVTALTHGNEVSGAVVVDALLERGPEAAQRHADPVLQQHRGLSLLRSAHAVQVAHGRRGLQSHLGPARPAGQHRRDEARPGGEAVRRARRPAARPPFDA